MTEGMDAPVTTAHPVFQHVPHPRIRERQHRRPVQTTDERLGFNGKIGVFITTVVGTMWAAYAFTLIALVSFPAAVQSGDKIIIVAWIAQTFLQLVLLPIIIVGQNVQAVAADARSLATYNDASAVLEEAKQIQEHLKVQDEAIQQILATLSPPKST